MTIVQDQFDASSFQVPPKVGKSGMLGDLSGALQVLNRVAFSIGWILLAIAAPLAWGFLPFGYEKLKESAEISAVPSLTVCMRMTFAALFSLAVLAVWVAIGKAVYRGCDGDVSWFKKMLRETREALKRHWRPLLALPVLYVVARILEMELLLNASRIGVEGPFGGALEQYGYFLGLLLIILLPTARLRNFSIVDMLVWTVTVVMVFASAVLNLTARVHVAHWNSVYIMTVMALAVAVIGLFSALVKTASGFAAEFSEDVSKHRFAPAIFASMVVNMVMAAGAAVLSILYLIVYFAAKGWKWMSYGDKIKYSMSDALPAYFSDGKWFWFLIVVVVVGSLVAPICQLAGVALHDAAMRNRKLSKYGISGRDWLIVCGGFEPMFVVLIGICSGATFISNFSIALSFGLVLAIGLLRVVKVWSAKNTVLRNGIFTHIRGSSRGPDSTMSEDDLLLRAEKLALLKFYDKRREFRGTRLGVWPKPALLRDLIDRHDAVKDFLSAATTQEILCGREPFYTPLIGGDVFFTQDDPFTHDVLSAQFAWLKQRHPDVDATSFSYLLKRLCSESASWKGKSGLKSLACAGEPNATPYIVIARNLKAATDFCSDWNKLLAVLHGIVDREEIPQYVNALMLDAKNIDD